MRPRDFFALALASTVALSWACGSGDEKLPTVKPHTATDVPVVGDDAGIPNPTDVDCSDPKNCYHLICWDDPACSQVTTPGGCKVGEVKELGTGQCRACTKDDCDGLPSYCCGAAVCQGYLECTMFICREIAAACKGTTSETCGFHDLDGDDAWGDCDEAPSDPCCFCHVAVGCEVESTCCRRASAGSARRRRAATRPAWACTGAPRTARRASISTAFGAATARGSRAPSCPRALERLGVARVAGAGVIASASPCPSPLSSARVGSSA